MSMGGYSNFYKSASADNINQVGSDEDLSKHSKVKRLSLETNRRRRELASRLKKEAEKEEKRKQEILEQRREKQRQATEKFQRSFSARTRRSPTRPRSPGRAHTSELDAMLHLIRTGAPLHRVSSWDSVRHHAWPSAADAADPWLNGVAATGVPDSPAPSPALTRPVDKPPLPARRSLFEQQLAERQEQLAMDQCRTLAEFSQVVESCVDEPPPADSLDESYEAPSVEDGARQAPGIDVRAREPTGIDVRARGAPGVDVRNRPTSGVDPRARQAPSVDVRTRPTSGVDPRARQAPSVDDNDMDALLDDRMFRREGSEVTHFRFVVEREEVEEEETTVEDLENGSDAPSVKSILKKQSAYSPETRRKERPGVLPNGLSGDALRDSIEITRVHMDRPPSVETPTPVRRKTVRFAEQLCEEQSLIPRPAPTGDIHRPPLPNLWYYAAVVTDSPSPKPRRVYSSYASQPASQPVQKAPTAAARLTVSRRVSGKPPQAPRSKPEKITTATLSRVLAKETETEEERSPNTVVTVIPSANQPTLVISSPAPSEEVFQPSAQPFSNGSQPRVPPATVPVSEVSEVPLDRTPTEADIEWLWAKVRSCLQRPGSGSASVAGSVGEDSQTNSELSIQSAPARPVVQMSSQVIDGASIYPPNLARSHLRISRQEASNARLVHHNISPHARRVALIRQREMNQQLNRTPTTNAETVSSPGADQSMSESMAEFLANEQMCQQSNLFSNNGAVPASPGNQGLLNPVMGSLLSPQESNDSRRSSNSQPAVQPSPRQPPSPSLQSRRRVFMREQYKPHSLQHGSYFSPHPPPARRTSAGPGKRVYNGYRPMSTLSVEEQRLMKSLERINDKLKTTTLTK